MGTFGSTWPRVKKADILRTGEAIVEEECLSNLRGVPLSISHLPKESSEEKAMEAAERAADPWDGVIVAGPYDHDGQEVYAVCLKGKA
nr:hypothetical protein BdHM001_36100 [Bdellovibrio sp. HM001]